MDDKTLIEKIDAIVAVLKGPVNEVEAKDGWTASSKKQFCDVFIELKKQVLASDLPAVSSIGRGMDFAGIIDGKILEDACAISNELNRRSGHSRFPVEDSK
jgi:hypothetical protein